MSEITSTPQADVSEKLTPHEIEQKQVEDTFYPPEQKVQTTEVEKKPEVKVEEPAKTDEKVEVKDEKTEAELKLELPKDAVIDESAIERISSYAKEKGLTKDQAQELVQFENEAVKRFADSQKQAYEQQKESWKAKAIEDKEIGGEKFVENVALSNRVIKRFASEALIQELDKTGLGNYPELVRVFARIGKAMGEDRMVMSGSKAPSPKSMEEVFYGSKE